MKIRYAAIVTIASLTLSATAYAEICGDVNVSSSLTTSDALLVLKRSVGQEVTLQCPSIAGLVECQGNLTTAGNSLFQCTEDKQDCLDELATCAVHTCGNNKAEGAEQCDGADLNGQACAEWAPGKPYGQLLCNGNCEFDTSECKARFDASGDTIIDYKTGLEWEKKDAADGSQDLDNPSDVDNVYTWGSASPPYAPDGTLFTDFLAKLNGGLGAGKCLEGHCDWRIPSEDELNSIVDQSIPDCGTTETPCVDPAFLPIHSDELGVWSSTSHSSNPAAARDVYLYTGDVTPLIKTQSDTGRAVRTLEVP